MEVILGLVIIFVCVVCFLFNLDGRPLTLREQYQILLQRPEWKQKRLEILNRDGYKCKWCGATHNL